MFVVFQQVVLIQGGGVFQCGLKQTSPLLDKKIVSRDVLRIAANAQWPTLAISTKHVNGHLPVHSDVSA